MLNLPWENISPKQIPNTDIAVMSSRLLAPMTNVEIPFPSP